MSDTPCDAISVVILTQGDRPDELARAVASVRNVATAGGAGRSTESERVEVVVVWNGVEVGADSPADVDVELRENIGIPAGRNAGFLCCTHEVVVFLDDDAYLESGYSLADVTRPFDDPSIAVVGYRISDEQRRTARRHVPRLGGGRPLVGGEVTAFLGGAVAMRATAFREVGFYAAEFFYAMEETDLALRIIDAGYRVLYLPDVVVRHPWTEPTRHADSLAHTARNRVWLAHRNLPLPVAVAYVTIWLVISAARNMTAVDALRSIVAGTRNGCRAPLGPRRPMTWSTVWRLTRLGRPPVV